MQRQVIAIFGDQNIGEKARTRQPALDRQARHRGLRDGFAGPATQFRPDMHDHLEVRRHVFQHLALIVADDGQVRAPARRADTGGVMFDSLARQMCGQRPARRLYAIAALCRRGRFPGLHPFGSFGLHFLKIADQQLKLLYLAVQFFR